MNNLFYMLNFIYKQNRNIVFIKNAEIKDSTNLNFNSKVIDKFTNLRLHELTKGLNIQGKLIQNKVLTEEYIKEKKNIKKKIEICLKIKMIKKEKKKMYFFLSDLKNIIKKKMEKLTVPFFFINIPSIKTNYIPYNSENFFKYDFLNFLPVYKQL